MVFAQKNKQDAIWYFYITFLVINFERFQSHILLTCQKPWEKFQLHSAKTQNFQSTIADQTNLRYHKHYDDI